MVPRKVCISLGVSPIVLRHGRVRLRSPLHCPPYILVLPPVALHPRRHPNPLVPLVKSSIVQPPRAWYLLGAKMTPLAKDPPFTDLSLRIAIVTLAVVPARVRRDPSLRPPPLVVRAALLSRVLPRPSLVAIVLSCRPLPVIPNRAIARRLLASLCLLCLILAHLVVSTRRKKLLRKIEQDPWRIGPLPIRRTGPLLPLIVGPDSYPPSWSIRTTALPIAFSRVLLP